MFINYFIVSLPHQNVKRDLPEKIFVPMPYKNMSFSVRKKLLMRTILKHLELLQTNCDQHLNLSLSNNLVKGDTWRTLPTHPTRYGFQPDKISTFSTISRNNKLIRGLLTHLCDGFDSVLIQSSAEKHSIWMNATFWSPQRIVSIITATAISTDVARDTFSSLSFSSSWSSSLICWFWYVQKSLSRGMSFKY